MAGDMSRRDALRMAAVGLAAGLLPCCAGPAAGARSALEGGQEVSSGEWDISVCGLNCARCTVLTEQKECAGCRGPIEQNWSGNCKFRPCAKARGHDYCFECDEFPCDKLQAFANDGYEHHRLAVENMKRMREIGLERWLAEQPKVMFCPGWLF